MPTLVESRCSPPITPDVSLFGVKTDGLRVARAYTGKSSFRFRPVGLREIQVGSRCQNAATTGTRGCAPDSHRAFDWQPRDRLRSAVLCRAPRRGAPIARFRQWSVQRPSVLFEKGSPQYKLSFPSKSVHNRDLEHPQLAPFEPILRQLWTLVFQQGIEALQKADLLRDPKDLLSVIEDNAVIAGTLPARRRKLLLSPVALC